MTGSDSADQLNITWLDPMNNTVSSVIVITGSISTLNMTFNPLTASGAGKYTCIAMLDGAVQSEAMTITVQSECLLFSYHILPGLISTFGLFDQVITQY